MTIQSKNDLICYRDRNVHIAGVAGTEGFAILEYLLSRGFTHLTAHNLVGGADLDRAFNTAHVALDKSARKAALHRLHTADIVLKTGIDYLDGIDTADLMFATQNWFAHAANAPLQSAREHGIPMAFITQLYLALSPAPVVAVTGTNGKTTVSTWIHHILTQADIPCLMSGNDRYHPQVLNRLHELPEHGILVLEVSNRQLMEINKGPYMAVLTGIQPDHVDEHGSFDNYLNTKIRLFERVPDEGISLLNRDDPYYRMVYRRSSGRRVSYGFQPPQNPMETGLTRDTPCQCIIREDTGDTVLFNAGDIPLPGRHNRLNALAAAAAARLMGAPAGAIQAGIASFQGVKHRLECLATIGGIRYFDDEASTNPSATAAALHALSETERPVVLICGGDVKDNIEDYQRLDKIMPAQVKHLICLPGEAGKHVAAIAVSAGISVDTVNNLSEAMACADAVLTPGMDLVLSPAGAGFHSRYNTGPRGFRRMIRDRKRRHRRPSKPARNPAAPLTPMDARNVPDLGTCFFKHEYLCPTGSHKDRAARYQVACARTDQAPGVIIPSSGNAAIAVAAAGRELNMPVYAFLAPGTHPGKLEAMAEFDPRIIICERSIRRAGNAARRFGMPNLRPSRDPRAVRGFMSLGFEIAKQDPAEQVTDLFIFCTSGATLTGIARAFTELKNRGKRTRFPRLHAVQSGAATDLARRFDRRPVPAQRKKDSRKAGFGGVSGSPLTHELAEAIAQSGGSGWFIEETETADAGKTLKSMGIETSAEGWAALAAVRRFKATGNAPEDIQPLVILTGRYYPDHPRPADLSNCAVCRSTTYKGIEEFISQWHTVHP